MYEKFAYLPDCMCFELWYSIGLLRSKQYKIKPCTVNALKFRTLFNKILIIRAGIHKTLVRMVSREHPDQNASEAVGSGFALFVYAFWQVTSV